MLPSGSCSLTSPASGSCRPGECRRSLCNVDVAEDKRPLTPTCNQRAPVLQQVQAELCACWQPDLATFQLRDNSCPVWLVSYDKHLVCEQLAVPRPMTLTKKPITAQSTRTHVQLPRRSAVFGPIVLPSSCRVSQRSFNSDFSAT